MHPCSVLVLPQGRSPAGGFWPVPLGSWPCLGGCSVGFTASTAWWMTARARLAPAIPMTTPHIDEDAMLDKSTLRNRLDSSSRGTAPPYRRRRRLHQNGAERCMQVINWSEHVSYRLSESPIPRLAAVCIYFGLASPHSAPLDGWGHRDSGRGRCCSCCNQRAGRCDLCAGGSQPRGRQSGQELRAAQL